MYPIFVFLSEQPKAASTGLANYLTPLVALIAAYIAFQQWRVTRNKWRLDLYEKRYSTYRIFFKFIEEVRATTGGHGNDWLEQFLTNVSENEFLFAEDIFGYARELYSQAGMLASMRDHIADAKMPVKADSAYMIEFVKLKSRFDLEQFKCGKRFDKYLAFRRV